ncbi:hypothetical protein AAE02nite_39000 [Adhaeribacter aerolatus]|uniref:Uncharacterized protein n=1 Tax=Adhaeribacter aerolatus TaxID=670289 RepID=A0A512B2P6_9BACT|nr:hypothetical protein [Adhaeribacter aerolatus]GEO06236.1 hypothetical protein AAE02nite_39000 [Adhaeribacter aerolatus]
METQGKWTRDAEGFMEFDSSALQRLYETVTDAYHQVYNNYLDQSDDEEEAHQQALADGYEMVTDYKTINGSEEFVTSYTTPTHVADIWYVFDAVSGKRIYDRGFIRIKSK